MVTTDVWIDVKNDRTHHLHISYLVDTRNKFHKKMVVFRNFCQSEPPIYSVRHLDLGKSHFKFSEF